MGIRKDVNEQARNTAHFSAESVLGRMERGGYKPTDEDLADLEKLAATGNRAERRAAGRHLKKHGIAAPAATPRQPIVAPAEPEVVPARAPAPVAQTKPKSKEVAAKKPAQAPAAKAPAKKAAVKKTVVKKEAAKKAAPVKKAAVKKTAAKKTAVKKSVVKKAPAKKTPRKK